MEGTARQIRKCQIYDSSFGEPREIFEQAKVLKMSQGLRLAQLSLLDRKVFQMDNFYLLRFVGIDLDNHKFLSRFYWDFLAETLCRILELQC